MRHDDLPGFVKSNLHENNTPPMKPRLQPLGESIGEIDLIRIYYTLRSQVWIVLTCVGVGLLLGAAYLWHTPKIYEGQAVIQVGRAERKVVNIDGVDTDNLESVEALRTLEQNLSNWTLLERVVRNPKLGLTGAALGLKARGGQPPDEGAVIYALAKGISVSLVRGTRLISIKAEAVNPRVAGLLPNAIIEEYRAQVFETHSDITRQANSFLLGEVKRLNAKLQASKEALQDYREKTKAVSLEESHNITDARLRELNAKVTEAKTARLRLESDYTQVRALTGKGPDLLLNVASVASAPIVLDQKRNLTAQEAELANLSQRYKSKHPKYIQAQSRLEELRAGLDRAIKIAADGLATSVESARVTEQKFEDALREQEGKSLELGRLAIDYETMSRAVESDTTLYQSVLTRLNETDVTKNIEPETVRVISPSTQPAAPAKPRKKVVLAFACLAGGLIGGAIAIGRVAVDRSLHTVDEAEKFLDLPALGSVPRDATLVKTAENFPVLREPHGAAAENFRTLRTSLALLAPSIDRRSFLFTSAVPGEGKSFCASNYAIALAQQGLRTLLIDADMRLPALQAIFFEAQPQHVGLADVLLDRVPLAEAARATNPPKLFVLTAGLRPKQPAELLAGPRFGELIRLAMEQYDRVVIDTAPVNAVSDTLLLVRAVQAVVLVVHAARTSRKAVARAHLKLTDAGAPLAGLVLNQLPPAGGRDYYYHYSSGSYGEGVYGAPERPAK
jgi:succinoglycan biosynthesis transport protein ExoP